MKTFKMQAHEKPINVLKLNFDGDLLFSGSSDKKINLWYSLTGERIGQYTCKGANRALDITNDSQFLVAGSLDGVVELFKVDGGEQLGFMRRKGKTKQMDFSYGDKYLLILFESMTGAEFTIKIYETEKFFNTLKGTQNQQDELDESLIEAYKTIQLKDVKITCVKWGPLNQMLFISTQKGEMMQVDLDGNVLLKEKVHDNEIRSFSISKDYSLILTASIESGKIIDPKTFKVLRIFKQEVPMNTSAISPLIVDKVNPKFHCLLAGGVNAREAARTKEGGFDIHIYNIMYEKEVGFISGHFSTVNQILFHKDGRGYMSAGEEGIIRMHRFDKSYFEDSIFE